MFYFEAFNTFYQERVRYLVVGGLAVNLYGVPRVTYGIDIIISTDRDNILRLNKTLKNLGYVPRLPVNPDDMANEKTLKDWIENKNLKAFSFYHKKDTYKVIDIVLIHPLDFEKAFENKTVKKVEETKIYLASIDDLIKMKESSGRPQDFSDIEMLKKARKFLAEEEKR